MEDYDKYTIKGSLPDIQIKLHYIFKYFKIDYIHTQQQTMFICTELQDLHLITISFHLCAFGDNVCIDILHPIGNKYYIERFHHRVLYELGILNKRPVPLHITDKSINTIYRYKSEIEYGLHPEATIEEINTGLRSFISLKYGFEIIEHRYIPTIILLLDSQKETKLLALNALTNIPGVTLSVSNLISRIL